MIQRIQTVYLFLAAIAFAVGTILEPDLWLRVIQGGLAGMSVGIVFLYKQRPTQALFCVVAIAVTLCYYVILAVNQPVVTWYMALPLVAVLLLFLARKAILKDEKLVRSLDRIR